MTRRPPGFAWPSGWDDPDNVSIPEQDRHDALAYLARVGALDLAETLGLEVAAERGAA